MDSPKSRTKRKRNRHGRLHQNFSSFINFGVYSTICGGCFLLVYLLLLVGLMPLLNSDDAASNVVPENHHHLALNDHEKEVIGEMANNLKKKLQTFRDFRGVTDQHLLEGVQAEFKRLRDKKKQPKAAEDAKNEAAENPNPPVQGRRPGFVVLGMHRSGTSMLSGLLVQGSGYNVGGPLIGAHFDNQKGFFERIDVVLQNDEFFKSQRIWWSSGVRGYDSDKALAALKEGQIPFQEGEKALAFLNSPESIPYLQKDPRMCITLKTWIKLVNHEPAVLFTYRHPLEVALSLQHREKFMLEQGLRLWIIYNMRGVQNSQGLCRVFSSNDAVLADPLGEVERIAEELTTKCGVPEAPNNITREDIDVFIDPNMQHGKKEMGAGKGTLINYGGCIVPEYDSQYPATSPEFDRELKLYKIAMEIHCDFKSGKAYEDNYEWPPLPT